MLDTRVRFYARTPTALFQKMTPPTAQRPPSTLSVNTYARRCVYVGVYVGAHARKLRARATRIVYIDSILSPPRSFNSSCLSNDCYLSLFPSLFSFQIRSFFTNFFSRSSGAGFFNLPFFRYSVRAMNTRFSFSSKKRRYR